MKNLRTVRVRIALVVNEVGDWTGMGFPKMDRDYERDVFHGLDGGSVKELHYLEAEVPLPSPTTIHAEIVAPHPAGTEPREGAHAL